MVKNTDFLKCQEERKNESFFKILQGADLFSENMRAIPHDFVRTLSPKDLSRKMKIKAEWGRSWKVEILKNPRFYYMAKAGWEKFVRENFLGDNEFLTFTHKGKMRFTLNMYDKDGTEMLQPRQNASYLASSSRVKTENREDVKKEEVVVSSELSYHDRGTTAASTGRRRRKLNFGKKQKKKAEESGCSKWRTKTKVRNSAGASSSSSATEFTVTIKKSYLTYLAIPKSFTKGYTQEERTTFKIHHPDLDNSWDVVYLNRTTSATFSGGWMRLFEEYPLALGDICKFSVMKHAELLLEVTKPSCF